MELARRRQSETKSGDSLDLLKAVLRESNCTRFGAGFD